MGDVKEVALELGASRATLYRLITAYRQTPTVEALEPRQRGRRKGALVLDKPRPAGGLRLFREGVEPSGSLQKATI
jgi:hypothetical protein